MIKQLHDDSAIGQTERLSVNERLLGDIIILIVAENIYQTAVITQYQTRDTITGTHPDVMQFILHNRVDHIVQQSVATGKDFRKIVGVLLIKLYS